MANNATIPGGVPVAQPVYTVDATTGAPATAGGGQQYVDGAAAPANPVGTQLIFKNGANMAAASAAVPLPVSATIQAVAGTALAADVSNSELRVSNYVKSAAAGDTALTLGQAAMANSLPVTLASNQSNVNVNMAQMGGIATQMMTADAVTAANVMEMGIGGYNGATVDRILADLKALRVSLYGKNVASGDTPVFVDTTGRIVTQQLINYYISQGQAFSASTGKQTTAGAIQTGACLFANNIARNILIYSVRVGVAASSLHQLNIVTVDPLISGVTFAASNKRTSGGATALVTLEAQNTAVATTGSIHDTVYLLANTMVDFMSDGEYIFIPANTVAGALVLVNTSTNSWMCDIKWIEF